MHVISHSFHVPKAGASERDYEDAAYPAWFHQSRSSGFRCAIADGATESSFSREWARRLVRHFGWGTLTYKKFNEVIPKLQERWQKQVNRRPLAWFAEEAASRGAFAAFLGLSLRCTDEQNGPRIWRAIALGDACMFVVRGERLVKAFPLETSEAFNNRPYLLSTQQHTWQAEQSALRRIRGTFELYDDFYLATDAIAQWFLMEHEAGRKPWSELLDLDTSDQKRTFREMVEALRREKKIRNDDTTLLRVSVVR